MKAQKIRRVDFSPTEWLEGTGELSDEDRGVYITICALIWARGKRIDYALLKRHSLSHGNKLLAALARLENARKIVRKGLEIGQKRAEKELKNAQKRSRSAAENAQQRWQTNGIGDAPAMRQHMRPLSDGNANHQPSTIKESITPKSPPSGDHLGNGEDRRNPRANGTNQRALQTNPRAVQWAHLNGLSTTQLAKLFNQSKDAAERAEIRERMRKPGF